MEFKNLTGYKYVRLSTNEFRFTELRVCGEAHRDLVQEGEQAISAGVIGIFPNKFIFIDNGSMTLKIYGSLEDDKELLEKITGRMRTERQGGNGQ